MSNLQEKYKMVEMEPLQHLVNDRVLALAQHALDAGMKYAVLDPHRQDGLILVITASYSMAEGIANAAAHTPSTGSGGKPRTLHVASLISIIAVGKARSTRTGT
ncbi:hypothetical protein [Acidithiobacillus ferrivorans]|uniref:hypothetical protein n=1 Tax=Acidithiobacillus ferrivorans TaxID=160808 RepID=UPI001CBA954F|nr:hypothetical protein [Acidithiobacillus ferrivorans]